nr:reverse transcriptase domain-containing protein [Tanacetum cinerariifolium]
MDNKKHIVDLESFRDILHICLRVHGQYFAEPSFEEEILAFIHFLGHSAAIRTLTDVNINKLYQPWRSFAAIINKCLTGKCSGYDSLRLSQTQILRNKVNWHYVRDDHMFSTIKLVSIHQNTQQFGALLPIELTNTEIRNSKAYKEYYAIATGEAAPKPKASVRRTRSSSDTSITLSTAAASADEGTGSKPGVPDVPTDESEEELSWNSTDDEGDDTEENDDDGDEEDEGDDDDVDQEVVRDDDKDDEEEGGDDEHQFNEDESDKETRDEESFDPIPQTPENSEDDGNGEEDLGSNIGEEERHVEEEEEDELYKDRQNQLVKDTKPIRVSWVHKEHLDSHLRLRRRRSLSESPPSLDSKDSQRKRRKRVSSSSSDSSDNEDEETGHWKSRSGYRNQEDEDMSRPWRRQKFDAFTRSISDFSKDKRRRMHANVKTYNGTGDPDDHLKIFESAATIEN